LVRTANSGYAIARHVRPLAPPGLSNGGLVFLLLSAFVAATARGFSGFSLPVLGGVIR